MDDYDTIEEMIEEVNNLIERWKKEPEMKTYTYFDVGHYKRSYPDAPHESTEGDIYMEVEISPEMGRGENINTYEFSTNIKGEERVSFSIDLSTWSKHKLNIFETNLNPDEVIGWGLKLIDILKSFESTEEMKEYILKANDIMVVEDEKGLPKEPLTKETATFEEWMKELAEQFYPIDIRDLPDFAFRDYYDGGEDTYATAFDMKEELGMSHRIYE